MNATLPKDDAAGRERLAWLRLARSDGVGAVTFARLLERFGTAERALAALPELKKRASWNLGKTATTPEVTAELAALAKLGAALLTRADPAYPERLRHIPDPPPVLAVRGDADLLRAPSVAIIGARNASANGCVLARRIAAESRPGRDRGRLGPRPRHRHGGARGGAPAGGRRSPPSPAASTPSTPRRTRT